VLAALLCTVLFALSIVCAHRSARVLGGTEANFWRLVAATLLLGTWAFGFGSGLDGQAFPTFLLSGVVGIGIGDIALFQALPRLGSRLSLLVNNCLMAPFGALIEWLWLGTSLSVRQIAFGLVVLAGIAWALLPSEHVHRSRRDLLSGTAFSLFSALCGAAAAVLSRRAYALAHTAGQKIDGGSAAFQRVVGGILIAGLFLLLVKRRTLQQSRLSEVPQAQVIVGKWRTIWPWVFLNGLLGLTLGVSFMQRALETTPTGIVLPIIATTPIVVVPLAMVFEHERPTIHSLIGGIIAVAGVIGLIMSR
jgi:drug/metabolite transporter (DMT)-like permease